MQRLLLTVFIIVTINFVTYSQNFNGGIILGFNTSQVGGDNLSGFQKVGPIIGIFCNKSITPKLNLQFEMYYIHKGSNNPEMNNSQNTYYLVPDITSKYIETPLTINYQLKKQMLIEGGVMTAFLIDGYYNDLYGKINNLNPIFQKYDIGLVFGINYKYSENISFNARISNSIFPIGQEDNSIFNENNNYNSMNKGKYNSVLSISIYYHVI